MSKIFKVSGFIPVWGFLLLLPVQVHASAVTVELSGLTFLTYVRTHNNGTPLGYPYNEELVFESTAEWASLAPLQAGDVAEQEMLSWDFLETEHNKGMALNAVGLWNDSEVMVRLVVPTTGRGGFLMAYQLTWPTITNVNFEDTPVHSPQSHPINNNDLYWIGTGIGFDWWWDESNFYESPLHPNMAPQVWLILVPEPALFGMWGLIFFTISVSKRPFSQIR